MKPLDITKRIIREFPGRTVEFSMKCNNFGGAPYVSFDLYDSGHGFVKGDNLEDCIAKMQLKLAPLTAVDKSGMDIDVNPQPESPAPAVEPPAATQQEKAV